MIDKLLPLLNRLIPTGLAFKGLKKLNPRIGKYLDNASSLYGMDTAVNFLRDELNPETPDKRLRPDERAAMQRNKQAEQPLRALGAAAKIGGAALLGGVGGGAAAGAEALQGELLPPEQQQQQMKGIPYNPQKSLPGRGQAGYEAQEGVPSGSVEMGYNRTPEFEKREALKKYLKHKSDVSKKQNPSQKPMMEDIEERFERNYGQGEQENVDDALLAALNKILKM